MGRFLKNPDPTFKRDDLTLVEGQQNYGLNNTYNSATAIVTIGGVLQPATSGAYILTGNIIQILNPTYVGGLPLVVLDVAG